MRSKRDDLVPGELIGKPVDVSLNLKHGEQDAGDNEAMRPWSCQH